MCIEVNQGNGLALSTEIGCQVGRDGAFAHAAFLAGQEYFECRHFFSKHKLSVVMLIANPFWGKCNLTAETHQSNITTWRKKYQGEDLLVFIDYLYIEFKSKIKKVKDIV